MINPNNSDALYKFVLTRISGEPRVAIRNRHLEKLDVYLEIPEKYLRSCLELFKGRMRVLAQNSGKRP